MKEAKVEGKIVFAGLDSPEKARCSVCGGAVIKRKRRRMDGGITYFYRHAHGEGVNCPRRYSPTGER